MIPVYHLLSGRHDLTPHVSERLISLKVTDEAGTQSDTLEIKLDDRDNKISWPGTGAELVLHLGYKKTGLRKIGLYTVDEVSAEGPPDSLVIRARAADFRQSMKTQRTQSWDETTLSDIVSTIATRNDLKPVVAEVLKGTFFQHIDQTNESDFNFLTRLAKDHGAISKPVNERLLFVTKGNAKSATGKEIPSVSLSRDQLTRWRFSYADRGKYQAVIAHWHNSATGIKEPVRAGASDAQPVFTMRGNYPDEMAAMAAAQSKLKSLNMGTATGTITLPGNVQLIAEGKLILYGFGKSPDGEWSIQRVEHSLSNSGFTTSLSLELTNRKM